MSSDVSPTARALLALELVQASPGISAERLAQRLGVSERATRRYVAILREAGVPVESTRGPYGGYRVGRGLRVPPLMFTTPEALALVMAVLESDRRAGQDEAVQAALGKIIRVLPAPTAAPVSAVTAVSAMEPAGAGRDERPDPETTAVLVQAATGHRRVRIGYRRPTADDTERVVAMSVDPWAVVVRHGKWYLLCWSHTSDARRVLRIDRVASVDVLTDTFAPTELDAADGPDAADAVAEHFSEGWRLRIEVVVDAPVDQVTRWLRRSLGRLGPTDDGRTRLVASTDDPEWYARQLTALHAPFTVVEPQELRDACRALGDRLVRAGV